MGIYGHPRRTPRWRRAALGAGALLICVTGVSAQAPSVPPGPSSGPSNEPAREDICDDKTQEPVEAGRSGG